MALSILITLVLSFLTLLVGKTMLMPSKQVQVNKVDHIEVSKNAVDKLAKALRINTTSYTDVDKINYEALLEFHELLVTEFPLIHERLAKEVIADYSLLYTWKGSNESLKPILLLAHMDVVPVEENTVNDWTRGPFAGAVHEDYLYGRGTLDLKVSLIATMEAVEHLLKSDFQLERTIILSFGHDEEIGGNQGATNLVKHLKEKGVTPEFVLDEGMVITDGIIPGVQKPVALVGTAEKGNLTIQLTTNDQGGHSSMPSSSTSIGVLAKAIAKLESTQFPTRISTPIEGFIKFLGPELSGLKKLAFANSWLFKPVIVNSFLSSAGGNAIMRTTTAPTVIDAGTKANVLPTSATATLNFRLLPGDSVKNALAYVHAVIDDDRVRIQSQEDWKNEASPESSYQSSSFEAISKSIKQVFTDVIIAPSLCVGVTDSRYYAELTDQVYRFLPVRLTTEDLGRIHGVNERISIDNYNDMIRFYVQLIKNVN